MEKFVLHIPGVEQVTHMHSVILILLKNLSILLKETFSTEYTCITIPSIELLRQIDKKAE